MSNNVNVDLFYFFNHNLQHPFLNMVLPHLTHVGGFIWMCVIVIVIIVYARHKNKTTLKKVAILALIALLFSDLIVYCLKHLVNEPRPFITLDNVNLLISEDDPFSFPSGHTTSTFAVVGVFVLNMKDLVKRHYNLVNIALIIFAVLIPFTRMYVGVHYPGDVLAGVIIGISGALLVNHYKNEIFDKLEHVKIIRR